MIHTSSSLASAKIISRFSYDQNPFRSDKIFITTCPCPDRIKSLHVILTMIWKSQMSSFNSFLWFPRHYELGSLSLSLYPLYLYIWQMDSISFQISILSGSFGRHMSKISFDTSSKLTVSCPCWTIIWKIDLDYCSGATKNVERLSDGHFVRIPHGTCSMGQYKDDDYREDAPHFMILPAVWPGRNNSNRISSNNSSLEYQEDGINIVAQLARVYFQLPKRNQDRFCNPFHLHK